MDLTELERSALEAVYTQEIAMALGETKMPATLSKKQAFALVDKGWAEPTEFNVGQDILGEIVVPGFILTASGNYTYCEYVAAHLTDDEREELDTVYGERKLA